MTQIKPIQIIPGKENKVNPVSALPVDLNPIQRNLVLDPVFTTNNPTPEPGVDPGDVEGFSNESTESVLQSSDPNPAVPAIISVREQIIKFQPDGTAKIDVILEVQDIAEAVEYDIRVAKDAGNI